MGEDPFIVIDGSEIPVTSFSLCLKRDHYPVDNPDGESMAELGAAGFYVNLRAAQGDMDAYLEDQHVLHVVAPDAYLPAIVSFRRVGTRDGEDWIFGKLALGCPAPSWVNSQARWKRLLDHP